MPALRKDSVPMFACKVPKEIIWRLRLEALRSERTIRSIVTEALDNALPNNVVVVEEKKPRSNTTA